jgi:hypothetical protein
LVKTIREIEDILEAYSFEDILEINGMTVADVLYILDTYNEIILPEIKAVDLDD